MKLLFIALLVPLTLNSVAAAVSNEPEASKPNIVVILADDLGYGDPGCYNPDSKIRTPNLDRLAGEGIRLTDMHAPSGVCSPTRYGVLTGRYAWRSRLKSGVLWGYSRSLIESDRVTVASFLKGQGYSTGAVGKWHLGFQNHDPVQPDAPVDYAKPLRPGPCDLGFDFFFGIPASLDMEPYVFVENDRAAELPTETVEASRHRRQGGGGFWRGGPIAPGFQHIDVLPRLTEQAVRFIERNAPAAVAGKPFFLYLALSAPHTPWLPTQEFQGKTPVGHYGDFVAQTDWTIGQVLEALDRLELTGNTLVFATSDNGSHWPVGDIEKWEHAANGPWRGQKADIHEGGHRVPFIARWPNRIKPGMTSHQTACLTDLMATCAAVVGRDLPDGAGEDSYSLLPALLGTDLDRPIRPATVHHSSQGMFAVRRGDWKLVLGRGSGGFTAPRQIEPKPGEPKGQLYNLADDPGETTNLYLERSEIVERLTRVLEGIQERGPSRRQ